MKHIGMTLAVVVWGGVLFTADEAGACEAHRARAEAAPTKSGTEAREAPVVKSETVEPAQEPHAAKCQCGSAADCTCKKGTCECAKCKRRAQEAQGALEAERRASQADERLARADAPR